jgi:hypothetical protein
MDIDPHFAECSLKCVHATDAGDAWVQEVELDALVAVAELCLLGDGADCGSEGIGLGCG